MTKPSKRWILALLTCLALVAGACGNADTDSAGGSDTESAEGISIGAIPDQDPEILQRLYSTLADYLSEELGVPVDYVPVTDYTAAVSLFNIGDLDMVWFGALTGVQARLQLEGSEAILQRDIDEAFHSIFIANSDSGIEPFEDVSGLAALRGKRFSFGSESSTSGRLFPQFFLEEAGVTLNDFRGEVGFSGNHDTLVELVQSGTFDAGVLNEQVWEARQARGQVDGDKVVQIFKTPPYHNYHWVARPDLMERDGGAFVERVKQAFIDLDPSNPDHQEILDLFGAGGFIETQNSNYDTIETVGRELGLITD